jgi:hypothetical protein
MPFKKQVVLVNLSIASGLLLMFFLGRGLLAITIAGVLLFVLANVIFAIRSQEQRRKNSR